MKVRFGDMSTAGWGYGGRGYRGRRGENGDRGRGGRKWRTLGPKTGDQNYLDIADKSNPLSNSHSWPGKIIKMSLNMLRVNTIMKEIMRILKLLWWRPTINGQPKIMMREVMTVIITQVEWCQWRRKWNLWRAEVYAPPRKQDRKWWCTNSIYPISEGINGWIPRHSYISMLII